MFFVQIGGNMGCDVPTPAGPSQGKDLCVFPASPSPTPPSQETQIQDYESRSSPIVYRNSDTVTPTLRSLAPTICPLSVYCSFPDYTCRNFSIVSYYTLERTPKIKPPVYVQSVLPLVYRFHLFLKLTQVSTFCPHPDSFSHTFLK